MSALIPTPEILRAFERASTKKKRKKVVIPAERKGLEFRGVAKRRGEVPQVRKNGFTSVLGEEDFDEAAYRRNLKTQGPLFRKRVKAFVKKHGKKTSPKR